MCSDLKSVQRISCSFQGCCDPSLPQTRPTAAINNYHNLPRTYIRHLFLDRINRISYWQTRRISHAIRLTVIQHMQVPGDIAGTRTHYTSDRDALNKLPGGK
jgi:hypothetical protein